MQEAPKVPRQLRLLVLVLPWLAACSEAAPPEPLQFQQAQTAPPISAPKPAAQPVAAPQAAPMPASAPVVRASASASDFTVTGILAPDGAMETGDYTWNADGVADGPLRVVVDLAWQRIYVYRGGVEIGRSSIIYGADDKPTPTGIFPILQKKRHHISNLYGAPMPYMLRLTNDGIAIHASDVEDGTATHGCIGIPDEFAASLFAEAKPGDLVMVTRGWLREIYRNQA